MEVATKEAKFKSTASKEEIKFQIDDVHPEIIIKIVSDTYPNPRRTVSTEYVQNGIDSHKLAGKAHVPLDIQLPTQLDPRLVYRDYGVGMTEKDIKDTFTYVFRSTKNTDNDTLGGFGIGKLVFGAYSGIMHLDLYDGKTRRNYLVRLKDGFAGCQEQFVEACDEPRGVQVTIPVLTDDVDYFRKVAPFQYGFLDVKPNIIEEPDFFEESEAWLGENELLRTADGRGRLYKVAANSNTLPDWIHEHTVSPQALLGGLPFDLNLRTLEQNTKTEADKAAIELFKERFFVLDFEPGEVDIVPSRDNLKYNLKTCRAVLDRLCKLHERVLEYIQNDLKNIPELGKVWDVANEFRRLGLLGTRDMKQLVWNGEPGALAAFDKLIKTAQDSGSMAIKFTRFTETASNLKPKYDRDLFDPTTHDQLNVEYLWEVSDCKQLHELEHWLYTNVKYTRLQRKPWRSWVTKKELLVRCNNIRACLLFLTLGSKDGALLRNGEDTRVYVADSDCGTGDADKRLSLLINEDYYKKHNKPFPFESSVALYLEPGVTYDEFVNHLLDAKLGLKRDMFVNIAKLPKPASAPSSGGRSSNKTGTAFSENTMFFFNKNALSPSDSFNNKFWLPAGAEKLDELDKDKDVELVYVRVKAFRPCNLDPVVDTKATTSHTKAIEVSSSAAFKRLIHQLNKLVSSNKRVELIGVKPKVKMDKFSQIKHLETFLEEAVHRLLQNVPDTPPKSLSEEFVLTHAIRKGLAQVSEELKSESAKASMKQIPAAQKLREVFEAMRKAFQVRAGTLSEKRSNDIINSVDTVTGLGLKLTRDAQKKLDAYSGVRNGDFASITETVSPDGLCRAISPSHWYRFGHQTKSPAQHLLWGNLRKAVKSLSLFKSDADFTAWLERFNDALRGGYESPEQVNDLVLMCYQQQARHAEKGIEALEKHLPDKAEDARNKLNKITSNGQFFNVQKGHEDHLCSDKKPILNVSVKYDQTPLKVFAFVLYGVWRVLGDQNKMVKDSCRFDDTPSFALGRHLNSNDSKWLESPEMTHRWLDLRCLSKLEKLKPLPKMDKQTIKVISDLASL